MRCCVAGLEVPDVTKYTALSSSCPTVLLALLYLKDERTNPITQQHNQVLWTLKKGSIHQLTGLKPKVHR
jgi:hypothetical protein